MSLVLNNRGGGGGGGGGGGRVPAEHVANVAINHFHFLWCKG